MHIYVYTLYLNKAILSLDSYTICEYMSTSGFSVISCRIQIFIIFSVDCDYSFTQFYITVINCRTREICYILDHFSITKFTIQLGYVTPFPSMLNTITFLMSQSQSNLISNYLLVNSSKRVQNALNRMPSSFLSLFQKNSLSIKSFH